ncbi:MAG: SoxR reducing system RseC family protein [Syntrophaceae bacterium]|nr:SoxR reducing system RseC family protein [Syntrophaceae bacterium]
MLEEEGLVIESRGATAWVQVEKKSACETCSAAHVCHPPEHDCLEAENSIGAVKGQKVRIVVQPAQYLKASFILYGLPVIVFLAAAVAGKIAAVRLFGEAYSDLYAFAGAILFTGVTFMLIIRLHQNRKKIKQFHPVITEIIDPVKQL